MLERDYHELVRKVNEWSSSYYRDDISLVSDEEYDKAFRELALAEKENPSLTVKYSPTQVVGSRSSNDLVKITHKLKMLSLDNAFTLEETIRFFQQAAEKLDKELEDLDIYAEPKFDGLAISIFYENGILSYAATRGDGLVGEDVTVNIRRVKGVPVYLSDEVEAPRQIEIRGEVFMSKEDFNNYNNKCKLDNSKPLANTRNGAAGTLRQLDPNKVSERGLNFIPYMVGIYDGNVSFKRHSDVMDYLKLLGFHASEHNLLFKASEYEFLVHYESMFDIRPKLPMDIDGIVYKINELSYQSDLNETSHHPLWAIARKFPSEEVLTDVLNVVFQVGRTGVVTPVAKLAPVSINGVTVSSATLHNMDEIERLDLRVGDTVKLVRSGDVIPKITNVFQHNLKGKRITIPSKCPCCKSKVKKLDGLVAYVCTNRKCKAQVVGNILHFSDRDHVNISGFGYAIVNKLYDLDLLTSILDIYKLQHQHILLVEGNKEKSANNIISAIENSKQIKLNVFLSSINIPDVGKTTSKYLAEHFKSLAKIIEFLTNDDEYIENYLTENIKDVGPITVKGFLSFFRNPDNMTLVYDLIKLGVVILPYEEEVIIGKLSNQRWVITGTLSRTRNEIKKIITDNGGLVDDSVRAGKTFGLLAGLNSGNKLEQAKKLNVQIFSETEFNNLLNS